MSRILDNIKKEKLSDKKFLEHLYNRELKSILAIANIIGVSSCCVQRWLKLHGLKIRNLSESHRVAFGDDGFSLDNIDVFNGCMLGDACLTKSKTLPQFDKTNKFFDHIRYVAKHLFSIDPRDRIVEKNTKYGPLYRVRSLGSKILLNQRNIWYPAHNNFKKCVPNNLTISPTTLLHWFMDDGYSTWIEPIDNKYIVEVGLCTQSFTRDENEFLRSLLIKNGVNASVVKASGGNKNKIKIPRSSVAGFFEYIGPCPVEVPSMLKKWKIPQRYVSHRRGPRTHLS